MDAETLDRLLAEHRPGTGGHFCVIDKIAWPCDVAQIGPLARRGLALTSETLARALMDRALVVIDASESGALRISDHAAARAILAALATQDEAG